MNGRLDTPPELSESESSPGCVTLAALSPLAARTLLRACAAWDQLDPSIQACLLRRVSCGTVQESAAVRTALAALMMSSDWHASRAVQRAALERLAMVSAMPTWFANGAPSDRH